MDNGGLPEATDGFVAVETMRTLFEPVYIRELPILDGWGRPIMVWTDGENYRVVSAGRDGLVQKDYSIVDADGPTVTFDSEIVFGDGEFTQWPEGEQF